MGLRRRGARGGRRCRVERFREGNGGGGGGGDFSEALGRVGSGELKADSVASVAIARN
jgi:hypothetical protein